MYIYRPLVLVGKAKASGWTRTAWVRFHPFPRHRLPAHTHTQIACFFDRFNKLESHKHTHHPI